MIPFPTIITRNSYFFQGPLLDIVDKNRAWDGGEGRGVKKKGIKVSTTPVVSKSDWRE